MEENKKKNAGSLGRFTPEKIRELAPNEGAARAAVNQFGAVWGQGVGLQGQCYAIPTMQGGVETIKPYVDEFIQFAKSRPDLYFYVTRIGCGIAGFIDEDIAPLFGDALALDNVALPRSFYDILTQ